MLRNFLYLVQCVVSNSNGVNFNVDTRNRTNFVTKAVSNSNGVNFN